MAKVQNTRQQGPATAIVITLLTVALVGAMGWIFWQNFVAKDDTRQSTVQESNDTAKVEKTEDTDSEEVAEVAQLKYVDLLTNGDTTGVAISSATEAAALEGASQKLKNFFASDAGSEILAMGSSKEAKKYTVERVYGDYAAGSYNGSGAYLIWGPADESGEITVVSSTQSMGFNCGKLRAAKVPAEMVDGKCFDIDVNGSELLEYSL